MLEGTGQLSQDGRQVALRASEMVLSDSRRPYHLALERGCRQILVHVERERLAALAPRVLTAYAIDCRRGHEARFKRLLEAVVTSPPPAADGADELAERLGALLGVAIAPHELSLLEGTMAERLLRERLDGFIEEHLADPALTPDGHAGPGLRSPVDAGGRQTFGARG
jgi:hypothetical protein